MVPVSSACLDIRRICREKRARLSLSTPRWQTTSITCTRPNCLKCTPMCWCTQQRECNVAAHNKPDHLLTECNVIAASLLGFLLAMLLCQLRGRLQRLAFFNEVLLWYSCASWPARRSLVVAALPSDLSASALVQPEATQPEDACGASRRIARLDLKHPPKL